MGYVSSLVRVSVPAGALYWTVEEGIWSPATGSADGQKRLRLIHTVDPYVRPYVTSITSSKWLQVPDLRSYWNCGVKMTIRSIADFDAAVQLGRMGSKISQLLSEQMKSVAEKKDEGK